VKRAFVKEKEAYNKQEQVSSLFEDIMFLYPFFHIQPHSDKVSAEEFCRK